MSAPLELNPTPAKRHKFRNMLTREGGLIESEQVNKIIEETTQSRLPLASTEFIDSSDNGPQTLIYDGEFLSSSPTEKCSTLGNTESVPTGIETFDLLSFDADDSPRSELLQGEDEARTLFNEPFDLLSSPPDQFPRADSTDTDTKLDTSSLHAPSTSPSLLDFTSESPDVLEPTFQSQATSELEGLQLEFATPDSRKKSNLPNGKEHTLELDVQHVNDVSPEEMVIQEGEFNDPGQIKKFTPVDPELADRAFRKFSEGLKSEKRHILDK